MFVCINYNSNFVKPETLIKVYQICVSICLQCLDSSSWKNTQSIRWIRYILCLPPDSHNKLFCGQKCNLWSGQPSTVNTWISMVSPASIEMRFRAELFICLAINTDVREIHSIDNSVSPQYCEPTIFHCHFSSNYKQRSNLSATLSLSCRLQFLIISDQWVSEWLDLTAFLGTADSEIHIVHISHVIIALSLSSLK